MRCLPVSVRSVAGDAALLHRERGTRFDQSLGAVRHCRPDPPLCLGYLLVSASIGSLFAYVSGSSLFLINVVGLEPQQCGLVLRNLARKREVVSRQPPQHPEGCARGPLMFELALAGVTTMLRLLMTLAGSMLLPVVIPRWCWPMWHWADHAQRDGASDAAIAADCRRRGCHYGCIQMAMGAAASGLVATLYDGHWRSR
jgi:DHA1 family bicyclomycin/chloramphenicol resistance-like MFS transporter